MQRLTEKGHQMDVQILDKEGSTEFKKTIVDDWNATYQLVSPNFHIRNIARRAIRTSKAHFISVLAVLDPTFPKFIWDNLLVQTELTINLLLQATLNTSMSAWGYFNGTFDFTATPLGPIGCKLIIHTTKNKQKSWDHRGREGFSVVPALEHYRCIQAINSKTNALIVTDKVDYLQAYLTHPQVTAEDRVPRFLFIFGSVNNKFTTSWSKQNRQPTFFGKPHSTQSFQHGNISMVHLIFKNLHWDP